MKNIESLKDIFFEGEILTSITSIEKNNLEKGLYMAMYSEKKTNLRDNTNHYKIYWDLKDFFTKESEKEFDWDTPHTLYSLGNLKKENSNINFILKYISNLPIYNKKMNFNDKEILILNRPIALYPNLQNVIYWALAKDNEGNYYKVYWNVINMHEPCKIEMTTDYSRYCKKCLKVWSNNENHCIDAFGHDYVLNSPLNDVMGVEEASDLWNLSPGTIKNYCAEGKIKAKKIGKTWIIDKNQVNPSQLK